MHAISKVSLWVSEHLRTEARAEPEVFPKAQKTRIAESANQPLGIEIVITWLFRNVSI